jgi:hypothetical protein
MAHRRWGGHGICVALTRNFPKIGRSFTCFSCNLLRSRPSCRLKRPFESGSAGAFGIVERNQNCAFHLSAEICLRAAFRWVGLGVCDPALGVTLPAYATTAATAGPLTRLRAGPPFPPRARINQAAGA